VFAEATNPLEVDSWLRTTEAEFDLLRCSKMQKTLFVSQQLCGFMSARWATFSATLLDGYQEPWDEFREAFRGHYIPMGSWIASSRTSWTLSKGLAPCMSTARYSYTLHSMAHTTSIQM
jgi:hypothetical protein